MNSPKGRILCTEDHADTRELLLYVLGTEGYDVTCASDPDQTIFLARTQHFDLFIVDNWLPGTSGVDLTRNLRKFDRKTPVLFYSAAASLADREKARLAGAQGYLVKPVSIEVLIKEVARLIQGQSNVGMS